MRDVIPAALADERVDRVVAMVAGVSRREAAQLIAAGAVHLDGGAVTAGSTRVREGADIVIDVERLAAEPPLEADASVPVAVVYADDDVIVVDKPEGVVVHPGSGRSSPTLVHGLLARFPELADVGEAGRPGIVHRLDKGTSGLMVVARTQRAYASLVAQLAERSAGRVYLALVWGVPESVVGVVDAPIGRSTRDRTRMAVRPEGKAARTRYEVLRTFRRPVPTALVECQLETGRTHQIRVHLAAIGHPVVGDAQYRGDRGAINVARPMLHAARLAITHPTTGERLEFTSALPSDMQSLIDSLE